MLVGRLKKEERTEEWMRKRGCDEDLRREGGVK